MLKKALEYYTRGFVLWVILLGLAAYHSPNVFKAINDFHVAKLLPQPWIRGCHLGFLAYLTANRLFFAVAMFGIGVVHQKPIARSLWPRYDASGQLVARRKTGRCCWR